MNETVFLNGKYLRMNSAKVAVTDRGFLYGDGIFDTVRAFGGAPFRLGDHVERLFRSAESLRIKIPLKPGDIEDGVRKLLKKNKLEDAYIRTTVTRGSGRFGPAIRALRLSAIVQTKSNPLTVPMKTNPQKTYR